MTDGHKHRRVQVKADGRVVRFLTKPRLLTQNTERVERSPYPYGVLSQFDRPGKWYYLSILSVLHRWIGLELEVP